MGDVRAGLDVSAGAVFVSVLWTSLETAGVPSVDALPGRGIRDILLSDPSGSDNGICRQSPQQQSD